MRSRTDNLHTNKRRSIYVHTRQDPLRRLNSASTSTVSLCMLGEVCNMKYYEEAIQIHRLGCNSVWNRSLAVAFRSARNWSKLL